MAKPDAPRLIEVDFPLRKCPSTPFARRTSATATSPPSTSGGPVGPWPPEGHGPGGPAPGRPPA